MAKAEKVSKPKTNRVPQSKKPAANDSKLTLESLNARIDKIVAASNHNVESAQLWLGSLDEAVAGIDERISSLEEDSLYLKTKSGFMFRKLQEIAFQISEPTLSVKVITWSIKCTLIGLSACGLYHLL